MFKKSFFILLLSINAFALYVGLAPEKITIEAYPGSTKIFSFLVRNFGADKVANCVVSVKDLDITPEGDILFLPSGSLKYSCSQWIKFPSSSFLIKPGETKEVSGYVSIPRGTNGSYDGIILCTFLPPKLVLEEGMAGVEINLQLSLPIKVNVGRAKEKLEIGNIEFLEEKGRFNVRVDNKGETSVLLEGGNFLIKTKGGIVKALPLVSRRYTLLRDSSRIFTADFKDRLRPGKYNIEAIIGYNEKYKVIAKENISVDKNGNITFLKEKEEEEKGISFEIDPVILSLSIPSGGFRSGIIKVSNKEEEPILVFMEPRNTSYKKGEFQILPSSSYTTYSIIPFIELFPTSLRLAPRQTGIIRYKAIVPKLEKGGKYAAISFSFTTLHGGKKDSFILPLELTILKTQERKFQLEKIEILKNTISFALKNEGNVLENNKQAYLLIKNKQNILIEKLEFTTYPLFPQEVEEIEIKMPQLPKGEYSFAIEIEGKIIGEQKISI